MRALVGTARRTESGVVDSVGHVVSLLERTAQAARPQRPLVLQRTHAHPLLEEPLHGEGAEFDQAGEFSQRDWAVEVGFNMGANLFQRAAPSSSRLAALAGAKTGCLRFSRRGKEADIGPQRPAAGATGAAENSGGRNGVEESGCAVAAKNLPPGRLQIDEGGLDEAGATVAFVLVFAVHGNHRRRSTA